MQQFVRTRIAPTPSGYLHLGNVFSFAMTAMLARRHGARILLRIDDLDKERVKREYVEDIFDTLDFLELPWDEGPKNYHDYQTVYSQVHRMALYQDALSALREKGAVFACECSRSALLQEHPQGIYKGKCKDKGLSLEALGYNWRMLTPVGTLPPTMDYFVVRKKDGIPAYQLASLVDDVYYGVDLVVRGADLWESTLAQRYLAELLGYGSFLAATCYHHALLKADANEKLSKSAGATSIQYLRTQGKHRRDIYALMGKMLGLAYPITHWKDLKEEACR
ncbi:glutamate--tRNA ligase family protein [Parapedobacter koreensis]|uniref:Glutamyl-tRNA synthetase n=1 Tax=Parapedobacter koreensis TaxID=332977 RepID=A0A1H7F956_9SPHI|nr:glutamate--tRNA ligase family protein [Parapedobacter koreensis]SEK22234.1 glutamyl-tRNA synthetase [Parapedobacter koreensis]